MINYLKSETERLEKGCMDKCWAGCRNWADRCPTCQAKLSTLIKTSWIFARKELKDIILLNKKISRRFKDKWTVDIITNPFSKELQEIISYCEAKAKEHKIDLEDRE
jgi:hypothetical protein